MLEVMVQQRRTVMTLWCSWCSRAATAAGSGGLAHALQLVGDLALQDGGVGQARRVVCEGGVQVLDGIGEGRGGGRRLLGQRVADGVEGGRGGRQAREMGALVRRQRVR
ncbi:hypothetical protein JOL62DRAFT_575599 [Phyllosticta paracitricarpa]|uniref:Uncharacterized protein n=1 Tax=Phyllosticta paracitricarpa TaxID=2016321 RepID=A0ABR1N637_9PEZI